MQATPQTPPAANNQALMLERGLDGIASALRAINSSIPQHPYKFRMYRNTALTATASAITLMPFDTIDYDPNGNCDVVTNRRYTAPVSGYYQINASLQWAGGAGVRTIVTVYRNGVEARRGADVVYTGTQQWAGVSDQIYLTAGDYIDARYYVSSALGFFTGNFASYFSGQLVSRDGPVNLDQISQAAWQQWTPTLTNFSLGNGSLNCYYIQQGKTVFVRMHILWGATTSLTGALVSNLPVPAATIYSTTKYNYIGRALYIDEGVALYEGNLYLNSSNTVASFLVNNAAGTYVSVNNGVNATTPFTFGSTDAITAEFIYEAA